LRLKREESGTAEATADRIVVAPVATMKALFSIYEIMRCSTNLEMDNSSRPNAVDHHYNQLNHIIKINLHDDA
jgi:hypothetical protein